MESQITGNSNVVQKVAKATNKENIKTRHN